jgi:hypothetical protein
MGYRGRRGRYPGNGPFRDLPPWQRPGWIYGSGVGGGYGAAGGYAGDPSRCARFPWLPRWWWANPEYEGAVQAPPLPSSGDEREYLQGQIAYLEQELAQVRNRLKGIGPEDKSV